MARRLIEQHWLSTELVLALVVTVVAFVWRGDGSPSSRLDAVIAGNRAVLYGTLAGLAGALLGFVLAAGSIIAPMLESPWMTRLRESDQYPAMWRMFLSATRGIGLLTLAALAALVFDSDGAPHGVVPLAVLFLAILSALQVATCVWILESIVGLLTNRNREASDRSTAADAGSAP